jgi:hypothetical protein
MNKLPLIALAIGLSLMALGSPGFGQTYTATMTHPFTEPPSATQVQAASGKHFDRPVNTEMRKAGGDPMHRHGNGPWSGETARPPRYRTNPHMLNPQPLPPGWPFSGGPRWPARAA